MQAVLDGIALFEARKYKEAAHALEEECNRKVNGNTYSYRGSSMRAAAWAKLSRACQLMEDAQFAAAAETLAQTSKQFSVLQPPDPHGERLCAARQMEIVGLHKLKEQMYWEARRVFVQAKAVYLSEKDAVGVQRCIFGASLATGADLESKGDTCFKAGEFAVSMQAYDEANSSYLQADIHSSNKPSCQGLAADLRQKLSRSVSACTVRRERSRDLSLVLERANAAHGSALKLWEEGSFGPASEAMQKASQLFGTLGQAYLTRSLEARECAEAYTVERLGVQEVEVEKLMQGNEYPDATALAVRTCKHYAELFAHTKKRNQAVGKEARLGHIRVTAALLEIAGTQGWWQWFNATDGLPALPHAYPGWLMQDGTAGTTSEGISTVDPGRALCELAGGGGLLFDHAKRIARRGYDNGMLFAESARLLALAGKAAAGMRLQLFRSIERGFNELAAKKWQAAAASFETAAEGVYNAYHGTDAFDRTSAIQCAHISFRALAAFARANEVADMGRHSETISADLRARLDDCEELRTYLTHTQAGLDVFVSKARRVLARMVPEAENEDDEGVHEDDLGFGMGVGVEEGVEEGDEDEEGDVYDDHDDEDDDETEGS